MRGLGAAAIVCASTAGAGAAALSAAACLPSVTFGEGGAEGGAPDAAAEAASGGEGGGPDARSDGGCSPACGAAQVCAAGRCIDVAGAIDRLRVEIACTSADKICAVTPGRQSTQGAIAGADGGVYRVWVRVRGVVEQGLYDGGTTDAQVAEGGVGVARLLVGGAPINVQGANVFAITVANPQQTYFVNAGDPRVDWVEPLDFVVAIPVRAGTLVSLSADPIDSAQYANQGVDGGAVVVNGVPPAPAAFDGQFVQVDVVSVEVASP